MILCVNCDSDPSERPSKPTTAIDTIDDTTWERIILLGETECVYNIMPQAVGDYFLLLWKFVLIHFTAVDLDNTKFVEENVLTGAIRRYISKANVMQTRILNRVKLSEARGIKATPKVENSILYPLGSIDLAGNITWDYWFQRFIDLVQL